MISHWGSVVFLSMISTVLSLLSRQISVEAAGVQLDSERKLEPISLKLPEGVCSRFPEQTGPYGLTSGEHDLGSNRL